jgi:hypothetical protein
MRIAVMSGLLLELVEDVRRDGQDHGHPVGDGGGRPGRVDDEGVSHDAGKASV